MRSLSALGLLLLLVPTAGAQTNGAVYTTDNKADVENVFSNPKAVYMAGGPGPNAGCSGNGLVDGQYFFQVTDPSGSTLLSSDPLASRAVVVSGGVISAAGTHSTRNGPCGSKIVQLQPFEPSPNSSGEYKVWLIRAGDYIEGGPNHGFPSDRSKTDNFKVRGGGQPTDQGVIQGTVFYDVDENGVFDPGVPGEEALPGWRVEIESDGAIEVTFTDSDGHYEFIRDAYSAHVLTSVAPPPGYVGEVGGRWLWTTPTVVPVVAVPPSVTVDFGDIYLVNTPEFARSIGFWHNQGESLLAACDPLWRNATLAVHGTNGINNLSLRDNFTVPYPPPTPDPTFFTVTETGTFAEAFDQLANFLVGDPKKGILANILSVQYAGANLNKLCGPLAGETTYIDRFGDSVLIQYETMAAQTLGLLSDPRSCDTGPDGDPEWRAKVQGCLSEWSGMNSEGGNIYTSSETRPEFGSPY